MSTDKQRLDFWNSSFLEIGYSAKMGGDGAGWYWQLGTNRRSGIKNVRDTLDSAMAQLKKPKQVAQDVAQTPAMRQNQTNLAELKAAYFDSYHPFLEALKVHDRAKKAYYDAVDALEEKASK